MHHELTQRRVLVVTAKQLLKTLQKEMSGRLLASFVIAGVDKMGVHLYSLHFDGTSEKLLFNSVGAGQFGSMSILEDRWRSDLDEFEAQQLIIDAISAGVSNDVLSAFNVNLCFIRNDYSVEHWTETKNSKINKLQPAEQVKTCITFNRVKSMEKIDLVEPVLQPLAPQSIAAIPLLPGSIRKNLLRISPASTNLQRKRGATEVDQDEKPKNKKSKRH